MELSIVLNIVFLILVVTLWLVIEEESFLKLSEQLLFIGLSINIFSFGRHYAISEAEFEIRSLIYNSKILVNSEEIVEINEVFRLLEINFFVPLIGILMTLTLLSFLKKRAHNKKSKMKELSSTSC